MTATDSLRFSCPWCGQHIECDTGWAGVVLPCPACGKNMTAPSAPALAVKVLPRPLPVQEPIVSTALAPPVLERVDRARLEKLQQRATFSLAAPVTAWILALLIHQSPTAGIVGLFAILLSVLGFIYGLLAIHGLWREREKGLLKAIFGTCLSGFWVLLFILVSWGLVGRGEK